MQYEKVYSFLITKLENELPAWLTYHDAEHTRKVIHDAEHIARRENVTGNELILLKTAALFHDAGFLKDHKEHEHLSCEFARQFLPAYHYDEGQIESICEMIMATKLPQTPHSDLAKILCDADLYYLGTDQYKIRAQALYKEFKKTGFVKSQTDWLRKQSDFLAIHKYFTQTAKNEVGSLKDKNFKLIRAKLHSINKHEEKPTLLEFFQDGLFMILGVIIASFALKGFLVPNHFFDGGVTGISLLIHEFYHFNLAYVIILLNLPLIIISYFSVGWSFSLKALTGVILLGICLVFIPWEPITSDKLLISIFGGVFLGIGVGLVMRAGAALDGIEVLALYTLRRTSFTISEIIMGINLLIFIIAAVGINIETALYSALTYFAATRTIDYVIEGLQAFTGVTIISGKSEEIKYELVNKLGRGITVYKGERGFLPGQFDVSTDCDIIFTVIKRLELRRLRNVVHEVDPKAFVFANTIKEASGGILRRRHHH